MWYDNLRNRSLWKIFSDISAIPRESGNEEGIREYLLSWAAEHSIEARSDATGNVIMKVEATPGYEDRPSVALQGHMDMVCVKREGSEHDFARDGIEIICDGTTVRAKDTSLGADNGIAIAIALDIFSDSAAEHGKLEGIFTVNEEVGLTGASNLEKKDIDSRMLLNLDSEEEGVFYIGCAGGIEVDGEKRNFWEEGWGEAVRVRISGLLGGHSGGDIHLERANAISLLGRYLNRLPSYSIASIGGGVRRNVIPFSSEAVIVTESAELAESSARALQAELREEYRYSDPDITIEVERTERPPRVLTRNTSTKLGETLYISPTGVKSMSMSLPGVVETSDNLALISMDEEKVTLVYSVRSSVESAKLDLAYRIQTLLESQGFTARIHSSYPAWTPDVDSAFTKKAVASYISLFSREPVVTAIHAGLECGIISDRVPGMDALSIGPDLKDVHSVNESVDIASTERTALFVRALLKDIK